MQDSFLVRISHAMEIFSIVQERKREARDERQRESSLFLFLSLLFFYILFYIIIYFSVYFLFKKSFLYDFNFYNFPKKSKKSKKSEFLDRNKLIQ